MGMNLKVFVGSSVFLFWLGAFIAGWTRKDGMHSSNIIVPKAFASTDATDCYEEHANPHTKQGQLTDSTVPADEYPNGWRPEGGIIDGQGCCNGPCDQKYAQCSNLWWAKASGPYFIFTKFTRCQKLGLVGGQVILEIRGHNNIVLPLLLALVGLLIPLSFIARSGCWRDRWSKHMIAPFKGTKDAGFFRRTLLEVPSQFIANLRISEFIMFIWVVAFLILFFFYMLEHARVNNLVGKVSRGVGGMCVGTLPLLLFPASRHSLLLPMFGTSFDRALKFHRFLGGFMFIAATVHMVLMAWAYVDVYKRGDPTIIDHERKFIHQQSTSKAIRLSLSRTLFQWEVGFPHGPPLAGFIAWLTMCIMMLSAFFRRTHWEQFIIIHMGYLVVFVCSFIHYPTLIWLCIPSLLAYAYDLYLRHRQHINLATIIDATYFPEAKITVLTVNIPKTKKEFSGSIPLASFATLNIPTLDLTGLRFFGKDKESHGGIAVEEHPFSISSVGWNDKLDQKGIEVHDQSKPSSHDTTTITFHISNMGAQSWTGRLADAASKEHLNGTKLSLDGPFGNLSPGLGGHKAVFVVSGGVGVTPMLNMLQAVVEASEDRPLLPRGGRFVFIWSVRKAAQAKPFLKLLSHLRQKAEASANAGGGSAAAVNSVSIIVFETSKKKTQNSDVGSAGSRLQSRLGGGSGLGEMTETIVSSETTDLDRLDDHPLLMGMATAAALQTPFSSSSGRVEKGTDEEFFTANPLSSDNENGHMEFRTSQVKNFDDKTRSSPTTLESSFQMEAGRPDLQALIKCQGDETAKDLAVYTCGPPPLVHSVEELCFNNHFTCHAETFLF